MDMQESSEVKFVNVVSLKGDLFKSGQQTLVNPINCRGKMGKGLALKFSKQYPEMFRDYVQRCKRKEVKIGEPYLWKENDALWILNFPTKDDWRNPSEISYIQDGLGYLATHAKEWGVTSLAIPALGCGLGELGWHNVYPLITEYLDPLDIPIKVYEPKGAPKHQNSRIEEQDPIKKRLRGAETIKPVEERQFMFHYYSKKPKSSSDMVTPTIENKIK